MPADILASILIATLALALELLSPLSDLPMGRYIEYAAAVLLPGTILVSAIYPGRDDLRGLERAVYSFGIGAVLIVLAVVGLYLTPWGASLSTVSMALSAFTLLVSPLAYLRRITLPRRRRFALGFGSDAGRWRTSRRSVQSDRIMALVVLVLLAASIFALAYIDGVPDQGKRLTEFYVLGPNGKASDIPATAVVGEPSTVIVGVANHEFKAVNYTLRLLFNSSVLFQKEMNLGHNQTWEHMVSFVLKDPGERQKLEFMLYKERDLGSPYKAQYVWVNVSEYEASGSASKTASKQVASGNDTNIKLSIAQNKATKSISQGGDSGGNSGSTPPRPVIPVTPDEPAVNSTPAPVPAVVPEEPPTVFGLSPDKVSPQKVGTRIIWTVDASDPDDDMMLYRFLLRGTTVRDWNGDSSWTWVTDKSDLGLSRIEVQVRDGQHAGAGSYDSNKIAEFTITESNLPPKVDKLTSDLASPQSFGARVTWTAAASDPENDPIVYRFFRNGLPATDWMSSNQWIWTAGDGDTGSNVVEVVARDGKHADVNGYDGIKSAEFTIAGPNRPPVLISLTPGLSSPQRPGTEIVWTAVASDPDKDVIEYKFSLDGQKSSDWSPSGNWTWNTTGLGSGDHHIGVWIRDGQHAGPQSYDGQMDSRFTVDSSNRLPRVISLVPTPGSPQAMGTNIKWKAQATDPDNDPILYRFMLNGKPATRWTESSNWTWIATGTSNVEVRVRDDKHADSEGYDDNKSVDFVVGSSNGIPTVMDLVAEPSSPQPSGAKITWTATASDPENDPIQYRFFVNDTPANDWSGSNKWSWEAGRSSIGNNRIEVRVRDGMHAKSDGYDGIRSASFRITDTAESSSQNLSKSQVQNQIQNTSQIHNESQKQNLPPALESFAADPTSPQVAGTAITWAARASDPENDPIQYRFFLNSRPLTDWIGDGRCVWAPSDENAGQNKVEVWIRDGKHAGPDGQDDIKSAEFAITGSNQAPKLTGLVSDLKSPQESGVDIVWTATAVDGDGDAILYRYFLNDEPVTDWSQSQSWTWSTYGISSGDYKVSVRARDGRHAGASAFDSSMDSTFTITSFIDREINKIVSKKRASSPGTGQESQVTDAQNSISGSADNKPLTPKKLGR
ncbi:MAG TPA: DUF1616 domain-containing protein [Methanotrichaceae archaeon]|nr:DUF1616 domain-containing protein [Methanotrichaceae archaeon]